MRLTLLLAATLLLGASPACAEDPWLRNIPEVRVWVSILAPEDTRARCRVPADAETSLYRVLRSQLKGIGLQLSADVEMGYLAPDHRMATSIPQRRGIPIFWANFSVVSLTSGNRTACATALVTQLRGNVTGQVGGANGLPVVLWNYDTLKISRPDEMAWVMQAELRTMATFFVTATRGATPSAQ